MVAHINQNEISGLGFTKMGVKAGVFFLVDQLILFNWCSECMAKHLQRAVVVVEAHVIEGQFLVVSWSVLKEVGSGN